MHCALVALTVTLLAGEAPTFRTETPLGSIAISGCLVTLIDEVEVPAREAGVLTEVAVVEGQQVAEGDLLARIDDTKARVMEEVAQYKLDVANTEAGNDINKRYAEAAAAVAKAEVESAVAANRKAPGAVPQTEVNRLLLQHRQFLLQIEQAAHELGIAKVTVLVREAELKAAAEDVSRLQITASLDGVVEKVYRRKGEWVQPGEPVMKLLRMNRLWIEGFVDGTRYTPADVRGRDVTVTVALPGRREQFQGKVVFASSVVEAGPQFLVKAEVDNRLDPAGNWVLRSGLNATMAIELR